MNLFTVDKDPYTAALSLRDQHIPKMILETAQILDGGTRYIMNDIKPGRHHNIVGIPASQRDNPVIFSASTPWVFDWALDHLSGLLAAFRFRWGHRHAYDRKAFLTQFHERRAACASYMRGSGLYLAMPEEFRGGRLRASNIGEAIASHRLYYAATKLTYGEQNKPATWRHTSPPIWLWRSALVQDLYLHRSSCGHYAYFAKDMANAA